MLDSPLAWACPLVTARTQALATNEFLPIFVNHFSQFMQFRDEAFEVGFAPFIMEAPYLEGVLYHDGCVSYHKC